MNITSNNIPAAKPVRRATTARGENPWLIASFPNMGASPRKKAEVNAAKIPAFCFLCKTVSLKKSPVAIRFIT